jgi:hypothetical protein
MVDNSNGDSGSGSGMAASNRCMKLAVTPRTRQQSSNETKGRAAQTRSANAGPTPGRLVRASGSAVLRKWSSLDEFIVMVSSKL